MSVYPERIREHFLNPRNVGELANADAVGETGSFVCGAVLRLTLRVRDGAQTITDAKFRAAGCGYLIATASLLTDLVKGLMVGEVARLPVEEIAHHLGEVPASRVHCLALCHEALHAAALHYRATTLEEWTGDEALICTCFGVSEKTIAREIRTAALSSVTEVTRACNAGGGCGSCQPLIEDILEDYWRHENAGAILK